MVFDEGLLPESAVAETLLDLIALQRIGVQLVVVVVGGDLEHLANWAVEAEFKAEALEVPLGTSGCVEGCLALLERGQAAMIDGRGSRVLAGEVGELATAVSAAKLMILLNAMPDFGVLPSVAESTIEPSSSHELLVMAASICRRGVPRVHLLDGHGRGC